jgi:hypothetical protein
MRGLFLLLGVLLALSGKEAWAVGPDDPCKVTGVPEARLICRIRIVVRINGSTCTATPPGTIKVPRNDDKHPILLMFYIRDYPANEKLHFDETKGVDVVSNGRPNGESRSDHFDGFARLGRRVFLVNNKNPKGDDKFDYTVKVWMDDTTECTSPDPVIHNTN